MRIDRTLGSALFGLTLMLAGCGGLLGGGGNTELYHFGNRPAAESPAIERTGVRPFTVLFAGANFNPAIDSDRILTVTGSQAAYVAGARWVSPAPDLFDAAIRRAFEQRAPSARFANLRTVPLPDYALGVEVRRFEADYVGGAAAPPEIVIEIRVQLMRWADRTVVAEWPIISRESAQENRVATIVDGFDRGTATVVARIADLTQEKLSTMPPPS
jgi:cholesterol transport system auxiliary component